MRDILIAYGLLGNKAGEIPIDVLSRDRLVVLVAEITFRVKLMEHEQESYLRTCRREQLTL